METEVLIAILGFAGVIIVASTGYAFGKRQGGGNPGHHDHDGLVQVVGRIEDCVVRMEASGGSRNRDVHTKLDTQTEVLMEMRTILKERLPRGGAG